jgi:hypothetical protein
VEIRDTVRDLSRVWKDPRIRAGGFGPGTGNTLMVEALAEERKVRGCRDCAVIVEEYTRDQVLCSLSPKHSCTATDLLDHPPLI